MAPICVFQGPSFRFLGCFKECFQGLGPGSWGFSRLLGFSNSRFALLLPILGVLAAPSDPITLCPLFAFSVLQFLINNLNWILSVKITVVFSVFWLIPDQYTGQNNRSLQIKVLEIKLGYSSFSSYWACAVCLPGLSLFSLSTIRCPQLWSQSAWESSLSHFIIVVCFSLFLTSRPVLSS